MATPGARPARSDVKADKVKRSRNEKNNILESVLVYDDIYIYIYISNILYIYTVYSIYIYYNYIHINIGSRLYQYNSIQYVY